MRKSHPTPSLAAAAISQFFFRQPALTDDTGSNPQPRQSTPATNMNRFTNNSHHTATTASHSATVHPSHPATALALDNMVPITFQLLTQHYARFESPTLQPRFQHLLQQTSALTDQLLSSASPTDHQSTATVSQIRTEPIPISMDNSMYRLRCACEEAADRLKSVPSLSDSASRLGTLSQTFEAFQTRQSAHVNQVVHEFLPHDFRANFFNAARQHSERSNANAIRDLMAAGGTVRDKYDMLWQQQWKRRETLASVGNATGIWKLVVKYLAGVPEPLLQFAKEINEPHGPTEALRVKFGPTLSNLTRFAIELNALSAAILAASSEIAAHDVAAVFDRSLTAFEEEVADFVRLLETVIVNSPFFVSPDQVASLKEQSLAP